MPNLSEIGKLKFYLLRGQNALYQGFLTVTPSDATHASARR